MEGFLGFSMLAKWAQVNVYCNRVVILEFLVRGARIPGSTRLWSWRPTW